MRIGIVDVDTSHPDGWIPIEREMGGEIVGVYDGGAVHPRSYVEQFAQKHNIPRRYDDLDELAGAVDVAIIHGCDWDTHVAKARPFVERGKAVLIDKPMAGRYADLEQFRQWARQGARITGGSAVRYCVETRDYLAQPVEQRGTPHTVICTCGVDEFNYGIHAFAHLSGLMGPGMVSAQHLGGEGPQRVAVKFADGRLGLVVVGPGPWQPFFTAMANGKGGTSMQLDSKKLYRALLEQCLPYLSGQTDQPPLPMDQLIEPELAALAALTSRSNGGAWVALDSLNASSPGYDGAAFAAEYRRQKYPAESFQLT
jgi:hypothetical protein